jgi:hypothetical protein
MRLLVVRRAALHARRSRVEGMVVVVAVVVVLESHARCIPPFVRIVAMRPRYLFSHVVTSLYIAAIAISRRSLAEVVTVDRAGNHHE